MLIVRTFSLTSSVFKQCKVLSLVGRMYNTQTSVKFQWGLSACDPQETPVLIVGQVAHLQALSWHDVRCKLEPRVTEEIWSRGVQCVTSSPGDSVELYPRGVTLASLPARCSRHAAPSRCHALAKVVRACQRSGDEHIVLVCTKRDVFASALAVARSFPEFSARSSLAALASSEPTAAPRPRSVCVQIQLAQADGDGDSDGWTVPGSLPASELSRVQTAADDVRRAARIVDAPTNLMNVDEFIQEAIKVAEELGLKAPTIIRGEELKERGMGGIYGVGKASVCPPALVSLSYDAGSTQNVAWVGKGIVYDTGGLSIKSRASMVGMKGDCGGAAAVLSAFRTAVTASPSFNLHAVLCLAENSVAGNATRPDDIHQLYSGRTVEINNTDAEGRLVLADGVVFASRDLKADTIVDIATLTGAQGTATGKYHAAILSNRAEMETACVRAGRLSGDLVHALPFAPELHATEFTSQVADMKNSVADRNNAQPSCAGLFILAQLGFEWGGTWLHVDMAAPAHCGERATGYGVGLLPVLFGAHTNCELLRALSPGPVLTEAKE